jgi:tetratricopeptide (TPR) repeat protein
LINKLLSDYPDDKLEISSSLNTLGDIYKYRKKIDEAIKYYRKAVDFEKIYPNDISGAYLSYAELVVKFKKENHFRFVEHLISTRLLEDEEMYFPVEKYKAYSILAIINKYKGNAGKAAKFALLAEENASAETSGFRYHKYLGLVTKRDNRLDKLVKKK